MHTPEVIVADSDGTLVDTVGLIRHGQYETARTYLAQQGIPEDELPDYDTYEALLNQAVGGSARDTLERTVRMLYASQPHHLSKLDFDALHDMLDPIQDRLAPEFIRAYDGLPNFLAELGRLGVKLAIWTSGTPHHIVRNLGIALPELGLAELYTDKTIPDDQKLRMFEAAMRQHFGLSAFTVVTCDDVVTHKPDPAGINLALERLSTTAAQAMVLGDHRVDMQAAANAQVPERVGITHGFDDQTALVAAGATRVVNSLPELAQILGG